MSRVRIIKAYSDFIWLEIVEHKEGQALIEVRKEESNTPQGIFHAGAQGRREKRRR